MVEGTAKVIIGDMGDIGVELSSMLALDPHQVQMIIDHSIRDGKVQIINKGSSWLIHDENAADDTFILVTDIKADRR